MQTSVNLNRNRLRAGMVGLGMIYEETYKPLFEQLYVEGLYRRDFGFVDVSLAAVASRTGVRGERYQQNAGPQLGSFANCKGPDAIEQLLGHEVDAVCVATPDDRHFDAARRILQSGKHVLIEKPSVLRLQELDELDALLQRMLSLPVSHGDGFSAASAPPEQTPLREDEWVPPPAQAAFAPQQPTPRPSLPPSSGRRSPTPCPRSCTRRATPCSAWTMPRCWSCASRRDPPVLESWWWRTTTRRDRS